MAKQEAGAYLKTLRERNGFSQRALGKVLGISGRQVQNWEWGVSTPTVENLMYTMEQLGGSFEVYIRLLMGEHFDEESATALAEQSENYEGDLEQEVRQRLERLKAKSPELARQFAEYGRFLDEHLQKG